MLLTKEVEIKTNGLMIEYYRELGYDAKHNKKIIVKIEDLSKSSKYRISCTCDICGYINNIEYGCYIDVTKQDGLYYCRENKCFTEKVKQGNFKKYGVTNVAKLSDVQAKMKATTFERYGVENAFQSEEIKEKIRQYYRDNFNGAEWNTQTREVKEKNGWLLDDNLIGFEKYSKEVRKLTSRNKKQLLKNWDGYDYYDGEYIKPYFNLSGHNPNYPTLDHKISLKYGYINNIDIKVIADISNLCFTKRYINSNKRILTESEFILQKK